jgi:hypothetical protein
VAFTQERLEPVPRPNLASSAADVRQAFFDFCGGEVPKKEVGLRLARKGFAEETVNYWACTRKTSRRVYRCTFDGVVHMVTLRSGSTGGSS